MLPKDSDSGVEVESLVASLKRRFIGFQAAFTLLFWLPVFYVFQKKIGLDDRQILGIQSVYYVAFALFEIPTGYFADRIGRRLCGRLGAFFLLLSNLIPVVLAEVPGLSRSVLYTGMLAHFLTIALARSLVSGALSAYLYDALERLGRVSEYVGTEGKARSVGLLARILGWLGVGVLMELRLSLPYVLTVGSALVAFYFAWTLPSGGEPAQDNSASGQTPAPTQAPTLAEVFGVLRDSPLLLLTMAQGIAIFTLDRILLVNLFQPILSAQGFGLAVSGPMLAWVSVVEAFAAARVSFFIAKVLKGSKTPLALGGALLLITAVMGACLSALAWGGQLTAVVLFSVYSLAAGFAYPLQRQAMNQAIPDSRLRATLISVESLIDRSVCAVIAWTLGDFLAQGRLTDFLMIAGAAIVAASGLVFVAMRTLVARRGIAIE